MRSSSTTRNSLTHAARPGSALIIVIGTLALISVFAAIYISVGRNDRRSATTVRERTNLAEITDAYGGHLARIVGDDRLDALLQPVDELRQYQVPRRITTDAPWTDWTQRSETSELWRRFNPAGHNLYPLPRTYNGDDPRVASDSWLAATRPMYLGDPTTRVLSQGDPTRAYLDNRDWYQITNIAPDGRFVNLANLRGNFRVQPGRNNLPVGNRDARLSNGLSLYELLNPNNFASAVKSFDPVIETRLWMPGLNATVPIHGPNFNQPDYGNTPAVFTMFQRFAFLPSDPSFITYNRNRQVAGSQPGLLFNDPDYAPYQWADADGDGMYDSRWFELTAARTPSAVTGLRNDIERFYDDSEYRVFAAARIIDLSSMVNVNTAIEGVTPPTQKYPLGLTPAEIDLRRLFTMQDAAEEYSFLFREGSVPLSMSALHRPPRILSGGIAPLEYDFRSYETEFMNVGVLDPESASMRVGRYAASAIRRGMEQHTALSPVFQGAGIPNPPADQFYRLYEGSQLQRQGHNPGNPDEFGFYAGGRADSYLRIGRVDPTRLGFSTFGAYGNNADGGLDSAYFQNTEDRPFGLYGIDDLAELLTYHGLNDPVVTSTLEHNALGRYASDNPGEERFSPLLSTRPLTLDRDRHDLVMRDGSLPWLTVQNSLRDLDRVRNGKISEESLALFELSPRTVMTPLSGASPLVPKSVVGHPVRSAGDNQPARVRGLTTAEAAVTFKQVREDAGSAFRVFYNALAGELEVYRGKRQTPLDGPAPGILNQIWRSDLTTVRDSPYATLFYAHRGPELALRIAAHAAVNTKDSYDTDRDPTVATLVLHSNFGRPNPNGTGLDRYRTLRENLRDDIRRESFNPQDPANVLAIFYPGLVTPATRFDIDAQKFGNSDEVDRRDQSEWVLARSDQNPVAPAQRQGVNVFGVEAMPVITEVASFYVYTDASESAGGDRDYFNVTPGNPVPFQINDRVTIRGSIDEGNPDLLASVVAFQIHNPWDVEIPLGGSYDDNSPQNIMWRVKDRNDNHFNRNNNLQFDYYIEYNGRYFKLGEFWEYTPRADSTEGFGPDDVIQINAAGGAAPPEGDRLERTFEEFQYRNITLGPGQTRVFYAMSHARFEGHDVNISTGLESKWNDVATSYGDPLPTQFTDPDNDHDNDGLIDGHDAKGWTGLAQEWIENQLSVPGGGRGVRIHAFDPTTGRLVDPRTGDADQDPQFADIIGTPGVGPFDNTRRPGNNPVAGRTADNSQVRLWRKFTLRDDTSASGKYEEATDESLVQYSGGTRLNLVQNDILVDRLFLGDSYLDVAMEDGPIADTVSFNETYNNPPGTDRWAVESCPRRNDNLGLSVMRWASVRRRDQSVPFNESITSSGAIYPWMIQSRTNPDTTWIRKTNKAGHPGAVNDAFGDPSDADSPLSYDDFFDICDGVGQNPDPSFSSTRVSRLAESRRYDVAYSPRDLISRGLGQNYRVVPSIAKTPFGKSDLVQDSTPGDRLQRIVLGDNFLGDRLQSDGMNPEVVLGRQLNAPRVADVLMSLGTGPAWAPTVRDLGTAEFDDHEWMTLTEAFAVAFGYENNGPSSSEPEAANHVWFDAARRDAAGDAEYVLDNLHLRLDDYVAFLNVVRNTNETGPNGRPVFDNAPNVPGDYRRGTGVPLAFGVIDQLRPFDVLDLPGDRDLPAEKRDLRSLTRPVMGLVNIQTAPLKVLRLLPGLTPSAQPYRADGSSGALVPEWWAAQSGIANSSDLGVARLQGGATNIADNPDVAAGIAAYRDRMEAMPRARSRPSHSDRLSYLPDVNIGNSFQLATNFRSEFIPNTPPNQNSVDRAGISGIPGLRGSPMFASLGELLAVSIDERNTALSAAQRRHLTIQAYYGDGRNLGASGSSAANRVGIDPKLVSGQTGVVVDDYAERLALAAGIMNTTSVRSDYFAAWFVIQGFRESDVNGLRPEDPLVPSFKRRYLMVIDRSNVIEPGDTPRIVLFKEVPL